MTAEHWESGESGLTMFRDKPGAALNYTVNNAATKSPRKQVPIRVIAEQDRSDAFFAPCNENGGSVITTDARSAPISFSNETRSTELAHKILCLPASHVVPGVVTAAVDGVIGLSSDSYCARPVVKLLMKVAALGRLRGLPE